VLRPGADVPLAPLVTPLLATLTRSCHNWWTDI